MKDFRHWDHEPRSEAEWLRTKRVADIVQTARKRLPGYQKLWLLAGISEKDFNQPVLSRFPIINKALVGDLRDQFGFPGAIDLVEPGQPAVGVSTAGTSETMPLLYTEGYMAKRQEMCAYELYMHGVRSGDRLLSLAPAWHGKWMGDAWAARVLGVDAVFVPWGSLAPEFSWRIARMIQQSHVDWASFFTPTFFSVLDAIREEGQSPGEVFQGMKSIELVGTPMTRESRQRLEELLDGPEIFLTYGNNEGIIAPECSAHAGYHVVDVWYHLEIINSETGDPVLPGQVGEIVMTTLFPSGTIFIRYATGDVGRINPGGCSCGRSWPLLEVWGRRDQSLSTQKGMFYARDLLDLMETEPIILRQGFTLAKGKDDPVLVIEKPTRLSPGEIQLLQRRLSNRFFERWGLAMAIRWLDAPLQSFRFKGLKLFLDEEESRNWLSEEQHFRGG